MNISIPGLALGSAIFCPCGKYRYTLTRPELLSTNHVCFVLANPSKANALKNDQTIRRCIGFARDWGFNGHVTVNCFAFCATFPQDMKRARAAGVDIVTCRTCSGAPNNDAIILEHAARAKRVVIACGTLGLIDGRRAAVEQLLQSAGIPVMRFKPRPDHDPELAPHPLYLASNTPLVPCGEAQ